MAVEREARSSGTILAKSLECTGEVETSNGCMPQVMAMFWFWLSIRNLQPLLRCFQLRLTWSPVQQKCWRNGLRLAVRFRMTALSTNRQESQLSTVKSIRIRPGNGSI